MAWAKVFHQPTSQPDRQPASQPASQPTNQPTNQPPHQPTHPPTHPPARPPARPPTRPADPPTHRPTDPPTPPTPPTPPHPTHPPTHPPTHQPTQRAREKIYITTTLSQRPGPNQTILRAPLLPLAMCQAAPPSHAANGRATEEAAAGSSWPTDLPIGLPVFGSPALGAVDPPAKS